MISRYLLDLLLSLDGSKILSNKKPHPAVQFPSFPSAVRFKLNLQVCCDGPAAGMMVIFGGRTAENNSLKDRMP